MIWFTDHTAQRHSGRIIRHLDDALSHLQTTSSALNAYELFVLLCAAHLHDIGMQDFRMGPVENLTAADFNRIRDQHPEVAAELILARSLNYERGQFRIDLDEGPCLVPIALVAKAHGTAYFEDAVAELRDLPNSPGNEPFRGELLAALLLIGDEMDLHEDRASFPAELIRSPLADLHHFAHHYVARVRITPGDTSQVRRFEVTFQFPEGAEYATEVVEWVAGKLYRQCNLTRDIVEAGTHGQLRWDEAIHVRMSSDPRGVKRGLPDASRQVLEGILTNRRIVDREAFIAEAKAFLDSPTPGRRICILERPGCEVEFLLRWVHAQCSPLGIPVIHVSFQQAIGHSASDTLDEVVRQFEQQGVLRRGQNAGPDDGLERGVSALLDHLSSRTSVWILEAVDRAEKKTGEWIADLAKKLEMIPALVIRTVARDAPSGENCLSLDSYTEGDIAGKFRTEFGLSVEQARLKAREYQELSAGMPLRVLAGLELYRTRGVQIR